MKNDSYLLEAFLLGLLIYLGLCSIDVNVTVNVTDKPIISSHKDAKVTNIDKE